MKVSKLGFSGTVGVTGSRHGCTEAQEDVLVGLLPLFRTLRHGSCTGVDQLAHEIIAGEIAEGDKYMGRDDHFIVIHPPTKKDFLFQPKLRGLSPRISSAVPKEYLERNRDIVDLSDIIVAVPDRKVPRKKWEQQRGGTWYTINYAVKCRVRLMIVWPDGSNKIVSVKTSSELPSFR